MKSILMRVLAVALSGQIMAAQQTGDAERQLRVAMNIATVDGNLAAAIDQLKAVVSKYEKSNRPVAATALVRLAECYQKLGDGQARAILERVVREYGDQKNPVSEAQLRLNGLRTQASTTALSPRAIWSNPQTTGRGPDAVSPDGRFLAFTDGESGDVAIRDLSSGTNRRLTNTGGWAVAYTDSPSISPDGQRVAYLMYLDRENALELRVASAATGEATRPTVALRTTQHDGPYQIGWLPDGEHLVVVRAMLDRSSQIGIVSIHEQSFRSIKSLEWRQPNRVAVSPDGRFVAYDVPSVEAGSPRDIFVLAIDGSRETVAVQNPANDAFPVWSPDGSNLLFLSDRTGSNALWAVPITEGRPTAAPVSLKADVGLIRPLGMSKSGTLFYFDRPARPVNLYAADLDAMQIAKPPLPATERLIYRNFGATWSVDGDYLAYYSFRDIAFDQETPTLVIRTTKTGAERTLALPARVSGRFNSGPKWFPGNREVLIETANADGPGFAFYRVAIDSGNSQLLGRTRGSSFTYELSPDGKSLFFVELGGDEGVRLVRLDLETQRETELRTDRFHGFETAWEPVALAISPDGKELAMTNIGGAVEIMSVDGGISRTLFSPAGRELGTGALRNGLTWTPNQRFLMFVRGDGTFWKVPAMGGTAEPMNLAMRNIKSPTVHPDGKRLIFNAMGDAKPTGVWAFDDVLRPQGAKPTVAK